MMYLQRRDQFRLFLHSPPYGLLDWYEDLTSVNACIVTGAVYSRLLIYQPRICINIWVNNHNNKLDIELTAEHLLTIMWSINISTKPYLGHSTKTSTFLSLFIRNITIEIHIRVTFFYIYFKMKRLFEQLHLPEPSMWCYYFCINYIEF